MANAIYNEAISAFLNEGLGLLRDTIEVYLIDTADYTFDASHTGFAAIPEAAKVAGPGVILAPSIIGTSFRGSSTIFDNVIGDSVEAAIIVNRTTDKLLFYIDGFSVTPDFRDISIVWNPAGIFELSVV